VTVARTALREKSGAMGLNDDGALMGLLLSTRNSPEIISREGHAQFYWSSAVREEVVRREFDAFAGEGASAPATPRWRFDDTVTPGTVAKATRQMRARQRESNVRRAALGRPALGMRRTTIPVWPAGNGGLDGT